MAMGVKFLIMINTGTEATPSYVKLAGQRGGTLNRESDTIDMSSKDGDGWADNEQGLNTWSIEGDGILSETDAGYEALETAWMDKKPVMVQFQTESGAKYQGTAIVTNLSIEAPHDDVASYSLTLEGKGAYTKIAAV
jgi:TP901-1 family phage major tail protein